MIFLLLLVVVNTSSPNEKQDETSNPNIDDFTKKQIQEIKKLKKRTKLAACSAALRNSLDKGNDKLKKIIDNSKFDRSLTYDYLVLKVLGSCIEKIKEEEINTILSPDFVFSFNEKIDSDLIEINEAEFSKISSLSYTNEMKELFADLKEANQSELNESNNIYEEEIGLFGIKLNQPGTLQYTFLGIGIFLTVLIVFGGLYLLFTNKKERENSKKKKKKREEKED